MRILEANRDMCGGRVGTYLAALLLAAYPCFADVHAKDFDTPDAAVAALAEAIRSSITVTIYFGSWQRQAGALRRRGRGRTGPAKIYCRL